MLYINKTISDPVVDFAAEELKKYLSMMMPECGEVRVLYDPGANEGFRLGLMKDLSLDGIAVADAELDDVLYIDCDCHGGIISGGNARSVLLAVYEYLRQNGCRWLMPGVDGEYIPTRNIAPVKYSYKPSFRYRGSCIEGDVTQYIVSDFIDFLPKVGMNTFMMQFENPKPFYQRYYSADYNRENRPSDSISDRQAVQWKRLCEHEIEKRGLQLHDIGHGFTSLPFGIDKRDGQSFEDIDPSLTDLQRSYTAMIKGKRGVHSKPVTTNFCMSNEKAREIVVDYIVDFSKAHRNVDYLHVWLADGTNNHCECEECQKKTPSDFYMMLMNEIDEKLTSEDLKTRIVFICYVDTFWAPLEERIKNSDRFTMLFAPIFRSYAYSMPGGRGNTVLEPYKRNKNVFPPDRASSLDYLDEWKKVWDGSVIAFEYHFWRHYYYSISGIMQAKLLNEDVKLYKSNGINGIIECGSQRCFFPSGLQFYSYARSLFDIELEYAEIEEDYLSHAFGEDWRPIRDYLARLEEALPFAFFSRDEARKRPDGHFSAEAAEKCARIRDITREGRELILSHVGSDHIVQTRAARLLERHADFCDLISDWMSAKARGEIEKAAEFYAIARDSFGKYESELERYFDQGLCFSEYKYTQAQKSRAIENVIAVD